MKANVVTVAEELRTRFNYREALLDSASPEELKLIDYAIDEQVTDLQEDWTSKLGINLRFSVKTGKGCLLKDRTHALNIDYLLATMAPASRISSIKWCSRKRRTKRESHCRIGAKSCDNELPKKDVKIHMSDCMEMQGKVLLQYSRRRYRSKSELFTGAEIASGCSIGCSTEVTDANDCKIDDSSVQENSRICSKDAEAASEEFCASPEKRVVFEEVESPEANRELASSKTSEVATGQALASTSGSSNMLKVCREGEELYVAHVDLDAKDCSSSPATADYSMNENLGDNATCKYDTLSTCIESTATVELDIPNANMSHRDTRKRREVELQFEGQNNFVKSPCEGLRPRRNKLDTVCTLKSNIAEVDEENYSTKKLKKSTTSSIRGNEVLARKTSYQCDREGCRMRFKTKVELSLHNRNQCHHKECGKSFRSHKYVVLHQRVHDDERPLKCTWAGCTMSFKWAWARTEHLRLHTGERPYCCKIEGCGLTFRFVSDYSRHRRKTGHYINPPTK